MSKYAASSVSHFNGLLDRIEESELAKHEAEQRADRLQSFLDDIGLLAPNHYSVGDIIEIRDAIRNYTTVKTRE